MDSSTNNSLIGSENINKDYNTNNNSPRSSFYCLSKNIIIHKLQKQKQLLRTLEVQDELARQKQEENDDDDGSFIVKKEAKEEDLIVELNDTRRSKILLYDSFLSHQRYYDGYKHVNVDYFDFGASPFQKKNNNTITTASNTIQCHPIIIEQKRSLGKGGIIWDAAFILAEYLFNTQRNWLVDEGCTHIVELGAGTGITGILLEKALKPELNVDVTITDLPALFELMSSNIQLNTNSSSHHRQLKQYMDRTYGEENSPDESFTSNNREDVKRRIKAEVLCWGQKREDYEQQDQTKYDIIIGADIIASIYDPIKLARTLYDLMNNTGNTKIILSINKRLTEILDVFLEEVSRLFTNVIEVKQTLSQNMNPHVSILHISGKKNNVVFHHDRHNDNE